METAAYAGSLSTCATLRWSSGPCVIRTAKKAQGCAGGAGVQKSTQDVHSALDRRRTRTCSSCVTIPKWSHKRMPHLLWPSTTMGMYTVANVPSASSADRLSSASEITCTTAHDSFQRILHGRDGCTPPRGSNTINDADLFEPRAHHGGDPTRLNAWYTAHHQEAGYCKDSSSKRVKEGPR